MTFIDLFSGIGGGRRGFELAGHKCVGFCEFDRFAVASYTSMHLITDEQREHLSTLPMNKRQKEILKEEYRNGEWYANDICNVTGDTIPKADCWIFGSPCQSFSVAGKREGLDGKSGLIKEVFRILGEIREEDRPEWLIYENVKGMLSSSRGFDFLAILLEMDKLGYDAEWNLFNSKYHGVPHNRERVYTIGHLRRCGARKIFPIKGTDRKDNMERIDILGHRNGYRRNTQVFAPEGITETLDTCGGGGRGHHTVIKVVGNTRLYNGKAKNDKERILDTSGINTTLRGSDYKDPTKVAIPIKEATKKGYALAHEGDSINFTMPNSTTRRGRVGDNVAQTLDTACSQGTMIVLNGIKSTQNESGCYVEVYPNVFAYAIYHPKYDCYIAIRKLTPKECFRLQGWDDSYFERAEFMNSNSQLYKQAGNGITVNVVYEIGKAIA